MWARVSAMFVNKVQGINNIPVDDKRKIYDYSTGPNSGYIRVNCKDWHSINHRGTIIPFSPADTTYKNGKYYNSSTGVPVKTKFICQHDETILLVKQMKTHVDVVVCSDTVIFPQQDCENKFIAYVEDNITLAANYGMTREDATNYHNPQKLEWSADWVTKTITADGIKFVMPSIATENCNINIYKCGNIYVFSTDTYYLRKIKGRDCISNAEILKRKSSEGGEDNNGVVKGEITHYRRKFPIYRKGTWKDEIPSSGCTRY